MINIQVIEKRRKEEFEPFILLYFVILNQMKNLACE